MQWLACCELFQLKTLTKHLNLVCSSSASFIFNKACVFLPCTLHTGKTDCVYTSATLSKWSGEVGTFEKITKAFWFQPRLFKFLCFSSLLKNKLTLVHFICFMEKPTVSVASFDQVLWGYLRFLRISILLSWRYKWDPTILVSPQGDFRHRQICEPLA